MAASKLPISSLFLLITLSTVSASNLFREYIGAEFNGVKLSDVPVNPNVDFHFILSFANDYNGDFSVFWDTDNLTPSDVAAIKQTHSNVKVALSLGGGDAAYFNASSIDSWVGNAVPSLTEIIEKYDFDGIDIYYRQFSSDPETFAECIGQLLTTLKDNGVISFASIAPLHYHEVQMQYLTLWERYGGVIDYVDFQFYEFGPRLNVTKFLDNFDAQVSNYKGGRVLVSFSTNGSSGGLTPEHGFFTACDSLQRRGKLYGIFIWSADDSLSNGFLYEKQSQALLANFSSNLIS